MAADRSIFRQHVSESAFFGYVFPAKTTGSSCQSHCARLCAKVQYSLLSVERESGVAEVCKELGVRSLVVPMVETIGKLIGTW